MLIELLFGLHVQEPHVRGRLGNGGQLEISNQGGRQRHGPLFALLKGPNRTATSS